jgi:hypothetical protein
MAAFSPFHRRPSLLLLVKPDDGHDTKTVDAEACALSPVSVTMEDIDEKTALMHADEDMTDFHDDEAIYSSDLADTDISTPYSPMLSDDECLAPPSYLEETPFNIWALPPEIRTMIYENLLLSDSAFRLGHHGPYSHEKRKQLFPQILRTCKTIFEEASNVLYGDNTFYLGTSNQTS